MIYSQNAVLSLFCCHRRRQELRCESAGDKATSSKTLVRRQRERERERKKKNISSSTSGEHRRLSPLRFVFFLPIPKPYLVLRTGGGERGHLSGRAGGRSGRIGERRRRGHDRVFCRHSCFSFDDKEAALSKGKERARALVRGFLVISRPRRSKLRTCSRTSAPWEGGGRAASELVEKDERDGKR